MLVFVILVIFCVALISLNPTMRQGVLNALKNNALISDIVDGKQSQLLGYSAIVGKDVYVSSAQITSIKDGTAGFDNDDTPGNDSSESNKIVRSFDSISYNVDLTMSLKDGKEESVKGGKILVEANLPTDLANLVKWDVDSMAWLEGSGVVSEDGTKLTGSYTMDENTTATAGKQSVRLVLKVFGAGNGTEITPTFNFSLEGNENNEKFNITADTVKVSATGKYNVQLSDNTENLSTKTTVDYGQGETSGRMYGYGLVIQLYNESESKGLKGLEYPKGEISFDIDLKLQRSKFGTTDLEDITNECTPVLWNYRLNYWDTSNIKGLFEGRDMYFNGNANVIYGNDLPLGIYEGEKYSTYDSGDLSITQNGSKLKVTLDNYAFNGIFPHYSSAWYGADMADRMKIYSDNIGTFCVGYMQIFVPDNEASSEEDKNYYLTLTDDNINVKTISGIKIEEQEKKDDDNLTVQHILYKKGSYAQVLNVYDKNMNAQTIATNYDKGDGKICIGDYFTLDSRFASNISNDYPIYTANRFIKFDGDCYEPMYYDDGSKFKLADNMANKGKIDFNLWYVTKKDGSNWNSQEEMNEANITYEDYVLYDTIEDIPEDCKCIGVYIENYKGYIPVETGDNNSFYLHLRIKDTATIGETYGITQNTQMWIDQLDRSEYTIKNQNVNWPKPTWDSGNPNYIKTEYDENGNIVAGTNSGGSSWGETLLVVGANLHGNIRAVDSSNNDKSSFDLGRNENIVTYSVEPQIDKNEYTASQVTNVTLKAEVTIPSGLTYVAGSSKRGDSSYTEPIITKNEDGSTTLVWYLYNCTSGEKIVPITFNASVDNMTPNETHFETKFVVSEEVGENGAKIGNSAITFRTSKNTITIVNLETHRLYQETPTPIIENNGEVKFIVTYKNSSEVPTPDFQVLDILPFNGDGRGTSYDGTYTLKDVKVTQTVGDSIIPNDNLNMYITTNIGARDTSPKEESIGVSDIWEQKEIGDPINEPATVIALKGEVQPKTTVIIEITLKTTNNNGGNSYYNIATAQTTKETSVITAPSIKSEVVARRISGMVWYDTNENGVKDGDEPYASGIEVELLNADGSKAIDINGNEISNQLTNANGEYEFINLPKDKYLVRIETDSEYRLTTANVGTNQEINSKFEETTTGEKESYEITNLDGIQSPEIIEEHVNAGLVVKDAKVIVHYLEEDNTPETDEDNNVLKDPLEITEYEVNGEKKKYKLGDSYTTEPAQIENYITLRNSGNTSGTLDREVVNVIYYYTYNKQNITVQKVWKDNSNKAKKRPASIKVELKNGNDVVQETVFSNNNASQTEDNVWEATLTNLDIYDANGQKINYTVDEKGNEGTLENYIKTIEGYTITNTFTQNTEKINIKVNKVWEDNDNYAEKRPEQLTLILKQQEGEDYQEVQRVTINGTDNKGENDNEWEYTFSEIPKYDEYNNVINYTVDEEVPEFYTSYVQETREDEKNVEFEIRNTFSVPVETTEIPVTKIWNDSNNKAEKRPEEVTLVLIGKNKEGYQIGEPKKITLTSEDAIDENESTWQGIIKDLPKYDDKANEINYELSEEDLGSKFYTIENATINQATKTITNKFVIPNETIQIDVSKIWEDNDNNQNARPEKVTLFVKGNSREYSTTLTEENVTKENKNIWKGTIQDVPRYDVKGNEIEYTLDEKPVDSVFYTKTDVDQMNTTVTNTFAIPTESIQVPVTKIWEDNNNEAGKRPQTIEVQIKNKATGNVVKTQLIQGNRTTNDGWSYVFEVPKYAGTTEEAEYEIAEKDLGNKFYTSANTIVDQDTKTVTNKFVVPDERTSVTVTKMWDDANNRDGKRLNKVTLTLTGRGEGVNSLNKIDLTSANVDALDGNKWTYTFENLQKLDNYGNDIVYTVDELPYDSTEVNGKYYTKGNIDQGTKTVTNVSKYGKITVHYYIINEKGEKTETKVPDINGNEIPDTVIEKAEGETYETTPAENVQQNYELVPEVTEGETRGTVEKYDPENPQEITYYYKLKTPAVTNTITKTGDERITSADQEINYTINYTANVTDYIGDAEVTITDTLPYAIDENKSELNGGHYDSSSKTITWTEKVSDLDTYNGNGSVNITKKIKVVYIGLDMNQDRITNNVNGQIKLLTPEKTSEETNDDLESTIYKSIISAEKLVDKTEVEEGEKVTYTIRIKNDGNIAKTVTVADRLPEGLTFVEGSLVINNVPDTSKTATDLQNGIQVNIPEFSTVDVAFVGTVNTLPSGEYSKDLVNKATIDNEPTNSVTTRVTKTNITSHKESEPASGTKVSEGDTITYRIRVRNDGTREGTVIVKDTVPVGTTFVEGSIKVGEEVQTGMTADNLSQGIRVDLGINEEKVVEFKVTVNKLAEGTKIKNIAYINDGIEDKKVPEEPEHTYVEPKEEQTITKDGTETIDDLDDEITYDINYTAKISDYHGNATIVLIDTLPFELNINKTDMVNGLAGGTYDAENRTITWRIPVENIQINETREVPVTKQIKVVYSGIGQETETIVNRVTAHIEYETPERTSQEITDEATTTPNFKVSVDVNKVWEDTPEQQNKRTAEIEVALKNGTETVETTKLNADNSWKATFSNLPKYDNNRTAITYRVEEITENKFYDTKITGDMSKGYTITNTFKVPNETINVPVTKIWDDNGDIAEKRPDSVTLVLTGNDTNDAYNPYKVTLTEDNVDATDGNRWVYTFTGLPKYNSVNGDEITYTLSEEDLGNKFYTTANAVVDQDTKTITNKFAVPDEKTSITAKKHWDDNNNANGKRPTSVILTLTGKGQNIDITKEQEVSGDNDTWEYTFTDLPKYDAYGNEVEYTINEKDLNNEFYIKSNVDQATRTVTNKFQVPGDSVNVKVTKVWDDNNNLAGKRPSTVTLQIKNGNDVIASEPVTADEGWSYTFKVPKYDAKGNIINYTADESDLGNKFYTVENKRISGDMTNGYTITNKFVVPNETVDVPVTKVWDDNGNSAGKRPNSVILVLSGNGQTYKQEITTNADSSNTNNWKYTFEDLPKLDANGDEIEYVLSEELNNIYYTALNSKVDQENKTITNTFKVPTDTIDIPVVKEWNDNGNAAGKRPDSVTLVLTGNDINDKNNPYKFTLTAGNVDSTDSNKWIYTFTGLPKYNSVNGDEIVYTLSEEDLGNKFYTSANTSINQETKTVTNKFVVPDEKTSVTVTKYWDDSNNRDGKRLSKITLTLTGIGEGVNSSNQVELTEANVNSEDANKWTYTFENLPKLDNYGNEIVYTVDELPYDVTEVNGKYYTKGNVDQNTKTVTNISKYGKVIVHYYIINENGEKTEIKVPDINENEISDTIIEKVAGETYETTPAENVKQNYELVPEETEGEINGIVEKYNPEAPQEITYYYRLKTPSVTNTIVKSGDDRITSANQEVNYTVNYTANVTDYIGNAEVTIIDTLPYAIDEEKSDLNGGHYDSSNNTITWKENVSDINSYSGNGIVNITKKIKVVYIGLDMNNEKIVNEVKGNIHLLTPDKTSEETTNSFGNTIYKPIISAEKFVDKTEVKEGEKVTYTIRIKNDGNLAKTVIIADTLPEGIRFDNNTQITIGNIGTVYTEQNLKNGIQIEIPEFSTVDVTFAGIIETLPEGEYSKELKNKATIDNEPTNEVTTEVTKANITAHKESDPASGSKITEGDTITYRIRVRNDGTRAGAVLVKDTIPAGTTFVSGSIKVNDVIDSSKTATDLQNGIRVNLGINEEKVVEFKVTVNKMVDGTKIKNVAYTTEVGEDGTPTEEDKKVPEEPEHTYVEPKTDQEISKAGANKVDSLNEEITYNINYRAEITDYKGNATVVLVDQLPYAIDEEKSDLDGGTYDASANTITWKEAVSNIQITENREVIINKTIKVVYTGTSQDTTSIKNIVKGHVEYETPERTSEEVEGNWTTTTDFVVNIPVSKIWEDDNNKLGQRPTRVIFKLTGSDGSERRIEMSVPGTPGTTTTLDEENQNKWNDIFTNLPKYDANRQEIVYTLTEEEKNVGDLKYYDSLVTDKTVTNTNKYGKVTVHHYIMNIDGTKTTTRVPDSNNEEIQDQTIEGKDGTPYETESATNVNNKYELVSGSTIGETKGTIQKYDETKPQEVIYYYRLKPAKVIVHYLEKDTNQALSSNEQIDGHVDDKYNTDEAHKKDTIEKDGRKYTLVSDSDNTEGTMTVEDTNVTYYYLQNTKATVRYVARDPETGKIVKDLEEPTTKEGLVGDEFVTNAKAFIGYKLVESPEKTTIKMTKDEQTLIYYYEPVYTGLIENHIDEITGRVLNTEEHKVQVGQNYNIPSKEFEGYDLVESKLPSNATGTMGEELVTVNYYYIKKAVLEVNYVDIYTNKPITDKVTDNTKHEGDTYTTEEKTFENYDLVEVPANKDGTLTVETDEDGNIMNNKTEITYYYSQKAVVEEHHIDELTGKEIEEPTIYNGHVGDEYSTSSKEFLSYQVVEERLPENATGEITAKKIVVNYYYKQPAKVIVHYVDKETGRELDELNSETGEMGTAREEIEGFNGDSYTTEAKEFEYYTLVESPVEPNGTMKVEITKDKDGKDVVNNTIDVYYYYEPKPFNISVEKEVSGVIVNGERREATNGKLEKVDIYRKSTENTSVQVEYKIKVKNTGEIGGRATVEDKIPEGMSLANNDGTWEEEDGVLRKVIPEIGAGETKEYTVLLNWDTSGENMGNKVNKVTLTETDNVPGFKDNNDKDNTDEATTLISVETGEFPTGLLIVLIALVGLESVTLKYANVLTKRQKKNNKR